VEGVDVNLMPGERGRRRWGGEGPTKGTHNTPKGKERVENQPTHNKKKKKKRKTHQHKTGTNPGGGGVVGVDSVRTGHVEGAWWVAGVAKGTW